MKSLHVINSLNTGGAEKLILDSIPIYQRKGVKTDVLTLSSQKSTFREMLRIRSVDMMFSLTSGSTYNPLLIFRIIPFLKGYDIIHAHLFPTLYWVVLAKIFSFSKIKIFYTEHSTNNRRRSHFILSNIDRFIYSKLDFIGCISEGVSDSLSVYLGKSDRFKVIHNGIDLSAFKKSNTKLENYFFSKADKVIVQVSSFRIQKDQETLINALKILPSDFKLLLVGDGPLRMDREEQVERLGLTHRIMFLGIRNDIPEILNVSDIVVLSSHYEGFGLVIVEGMASKTPVIASNIPGLKEIVKNFGLLFEKGNPNDLAQKIQSLYKDEKYYQQVQEACFLRANDFDIEFMVDAYIMEYKKILK